MSQYGCQYKSSDTNIYQTNLIQIQQKQFPKFCKHDYLGRHRATDFISVNYIDNYHYKTNSYKIINRIYQERGKVGKYFRNSTLN